MPVVFLGWSLNTRCISSGGAVDELTRHVWRNVVLLFSALTIIGRMPGAAAALGTTASSLMP